jgi:adenylosuccinate lyase
VTREQAYDWVQAAAMKARAGKERFLDLLRREPGIAKTLTAGELERCFDLGYQLRHVDDLFRRVFGRA